MLGGGCYLCDYFECQLLNIGSNFNSAIQGKTKHLRRGSIIWHFIQISKYNLMS